MKTINVMKIISIKYLLLVFFLLTTYLSFGQNLITNPSAELDPTTNGWTQVSGAWGSGSEVTAQDGASHFFAGVGAGTVELYQDVDVSPYATDIDAGTKTFTFDGYINTFGDSDQGQIIVEYRSAASVVLATYNTGLQAITIWTNFSDARIAPATTRTIRIRLLSTRNSGADSDGYMDNLRLLPSAESASLILNPSAELDPTTNSWTAASGSWVSGSEVAAHSGAFHFFAGATAGTVELYQDIDVSVYAAGIDAGTQIFDFKGYIRDFNSNDAGQIIVEYRSATSVVLSTYDSGLQITNSWTEFADSRLAPATTRTIRIRLLSTRNAGTDSDGYIDNLSLTTISAVLPIELLSFEVKAIGNKVQLNWQTASEIDNDYFEVERSLDTKNWETILKKDGVGNSSSIVNYLAIDENPYSGTSYYRLKQTDFDGQYEYFDIKSIHLTRNFKGRSKVYPNPSKGFFTLEGDAAELNQFVLINSFGSILTQSAKVNKISDSKLTFDIQDFPSGIYLLKTRTKIHKIYKQ